MAASILHVHILLSSSAASTSKLAETELLVHRGEVHFTPGQTVLFGGDRDRRRKAINLRGKGSVTGLLEGRTEGGRTHAGDVGS